ncbi:hypothetical protein [Thermodesulfovibrio thiophilus]|uniref:hypothetical protein n=1 Tax=Thermodesulfovibrio thiophilus TaxID=340095 RepID=UPI0018271278|nr:hypothetical protein [Thermodesulfovibrio thiophilus]HHW20447.1 hypothetical protein [Thermodesulfovibrio thiophilus]
MRKAGKIIASLSLLAFIVGCETIPKDALTLSPESLADRQMQTRKYETKDEAKILTACAGLLQDMGFNIDESETKLGVITASKRRSAVNAGQQVVAVFVALLGGGYMPTDKDQIMRASIVTRPVGELKEYMAVRVTFQRIVRDENGKITKQETLNDPEIYQKFFDKLSKAIFLEAQEI